MKKAITLGDVQGSIISLSEKSSRVRFDFFDFIIFYIGFLWGLISSIMGFI